MIVRSQQGFALMQILMAAALISITALATATILSNISDASARAKFENDMANDIQLLRSFMQDVPTCTENLKGHSYVDEQPSPPLNLTEVVTNSSGGSVRSSNPLIDSEILSTVRFIKSSDRTGHFELTFRHPSNEKIIDRVRTVNVTAQFDSANRIVMCGYGEVALGSEIKQGLITNVSGGCNRAGPSGNKGGHRRDVLARKATAWRSVCANLTYPAPAKPYAYTGDSLFDRSRAPDGELEFVELNPEDGPVDASAFRGPYANLFQCENDGLIPAGSVVRETIDTGGSDHTARYSYHICSNGVWQETGGSQ